jgi:hypothetical protein
MEMHSIKLLLRASFEQEVGLRKVLDEQQDRSSPNFRKWLTSEQVADRFGLSSEDLDRIRFWLEDRGFTVDYVAHDRDWVALSGTAEQVQRAFHTEIHSYEIEGEKHFANCSAPWLPKALVEVVSAVSGLNDFYPRPPGRTVSQASQGTSPLQKPRAYYTTSSGDHYLAPADIATIYDITPLYNLSISGTPVNGGGQGIAIVGTSDLDLTDDVEDFQTIFGLPLNPPQMVEGGTDPGIGSTDAQSEAALDLEWAGGIAPGAKLYYVYATDALTAAMYAIDNSSSLENLSVLSVSFGSCELDYEGYTSFYEGYAQRANGKGITWVAGSGDSGAAGCDLPYATLAEGQMAVEFPASIPEVTAVGGTELNEEGESYWSGSSAANGGSATGPIPETSWNDTYWFLWPELAASGGGASAFYPKPLWQEGPGVPGDGLRDVPDVALSASWYHDPYIICLLGECANGLPSALDTAGGTSAAAPVFAGIVALLKQYLTLTSTQAPGGNNINPRLYQLAQVTTDVFHDVVSGNNIVPCGPLSPDCGLIGSFGYSASPGYDQVTGLGSVDAYNLVTQWNPALTVALSANPASGTSPLATTLTANVSGTAQGTINYTLWYNCTDPSNSVSEVMANSTCGAMSPDPAPGTCQTYSVGQKCNAMSTSSEAFSASYTSSSTAKVIAEQGTATPAAASIPITVSDYLPSVASVSFSPSTVTGGSIATGTVSLSGPAPPDGATVVLAPEPIGITQLPPTVAVAAGSTTGTFSAVSSSVPASTIVLVTASYNNTEAVGSLTVTPAPSSVGLQGLSFNPTIINSGGTSTGTVALTGPAPSGGAYVTLSASLQGVVVLPPPVSIPSGGTVATFTLNTLPVPNPTNVTITATYNNTTVSAVVTVNPSSAPVVVSNVGFSPSSIVGGDTANGAVTLSGSVSASGASVTFTSSPSGLVQLSSVTVAGGSTSASFSAPTSAVNSNIVISVTASYNGSSASATLTLTPPGGSVVLSNFTITPSTIVGGYSPQGNIFLTGNAPSGGPAVSLVSNNTQFVQVPQTVTVTPGYNSRAFPITTSFTSGTVGATITASYNGTMYGASLTVLPVAVSGATFYPSSVTAGNAASLTVYLTGPAAAGTNVSLTSSDPSVLQVPSTAPLTTGATQVSVTGTTSAVNSQTAVTVTADYNLSSGQGSLTVVPAPPLTVSTFNFSPNSLTGGNTATGTVTLTGLAPAAGVNVVLSSPSALVVVPPTVTVPGGAWTAPVTAQTSAVSSVTNVTVTASYGGVSVGAPLWLVPPLPFLSSLTVNPATVNGGSSVTGTITLTAPSPLGGLVVSMTSNAPYTVANVPQMVVIAEGATSSTFSITTSPISFIAPVTITASYNGTSQSAVLTIVPPGTPLAPSSLTFSPLAVTGESAATGTVMLTGLAPSGGAALTLSSDNSAVQVPLTIVVPPGQASTTFTATTSPVSVISTATITATLNGLSQSSLITVKPSGSPPAANPVPFLVSPLVPISQIPGSTGLSVGANGSGFVPGAQLLWDGIALPTTVVSESQIQAAVPASDVGSNATALVAVANPGAVSLLSNPLPEHLTYPTSAPAFNTSSLAVSGEVFSVGVGDFNRDGKADLAVGKADGSGLSIFLGNGDGTFGPERIIPLTVPMTPYQVAVADINGDGKQDIVFNKSGVSNGVIGILLGNGDGTFTAMPDIALPSSPGSNGALALADLNGDGILDLVVTGAYLTQAYVLLGNGDGTFGSPAGVGSVNQPLSVAVADFNGDGKLDIALSDYGNKAVAVLLGNGDGTFQPQQEYPTNGYPYSLSVADFNGDGHPDIAVANDGPVGGGSGGVAVLLNNGDGTFSAPVNYGAGQEYYSVATDDINGDGKLDLVVASGYPTRGTLLFLGNGDGTFSSTPLTLSAGTIPSSLALADLNGDGAPDILAPDNTNGSLPLLLQSINPIIQVVPPSLPFTVTQGTANPSPTSLAISNTGGGTETWSASPSQTWLSLSQTSGSAPSTVNVSVNPSGLSPGTYNATITITAIGASNSPVTVPVTFIINPPPVVVASLAFTPTALVGPGTATGTITLSSPALVGGVTVSLSGANSAVQVPSTMTVAAGLVSGNFTATASAVTTQTSATVTASYNGVSTAAMLTVNPPSIAITGVKPSLITIFQGGSAQSVTVSLTRSGYAGSVTLSTSALPSGVIAAYAQPGTENAGSVSLKAAGNAALVSNQTITITASGGRVPSVTATFSLTVSTPSASSIAISSVSPGSITLVQGGSAQSVTVNLTRNNYTGSVTLSTSALPSGVTATFTQPGRGNSGSVSLKAASNAALVNNLTITIIARGSRVASVTATFTLTT